MLLFVFACQRNGHKLSEPKRRKKEKQFPFHIFSQKAPAPFTVFLDILQRKERDVEVKRKREKNEKEKTVRR